MLQDLTKPAKELLLELINDANKTSFVDADLTFGLPQPIVGDLNTSLLVKGTGTSSFEGPATVRYNRLDLTKLFAGVPVQLSYFQDTWQTTHELLGAINSIYSLNLTVDDIINDPIIVGETTPFPQVLRAQANSLIYQGELTFMLDLRSGMDWTVPLVNDGATSFEEGLVFNGDWVLDTTWASDGVQSLRSSPTITDNGTSTTYVDVVDGTNRKIYFDYKVDSEQGYDFLEVWVNGTQYWTLSGLNQTGTKSITLAPGAAHVEWRYTKDSSGAVGADATWIDNVRLTTHIQLVGRGFFFSNTYFTAGTLDFTGFTAASPLAGDTNAPSLPNRSIMVVGPDQQIFTFELWGSNVRMLSLYPGDTEWSAEYFAGMSNLVASSSTQRDMAVFFKGYCYVVGIEAATGHWALFRINEDNTSGRTHTAELVYRMLNDGAPTLLVASETKLVMLIDDSTINFTDDGVNWTRQVVMHPYGGHDGNPANPPLTYIHGLSLKGDLLVGMGNSSYATGVANIIFFNGIIGGTYTWYQTAPYAFDYDYDWRVCNMLYVQDKLYLMLSEVYDNAGSPGLGSAGDILVSPDDGATWSVVRRGTGIYQGRMLWDGATFAAYGSKDMWPTAGRYLTHTQDFVEWTDVDDDSGYFSDKYPRTALHTIAYPEILAYTPLSVAVPAFIDPVIPITYTPNGTIRKMVIREDGKLLIGGNQVQYTSMIDSSTIAVSYLSLASPDLVPDQTFTPQFSDIVLDFDRQGNTGKLIVVGHFNTAGGSSYPKIAQLNADGSLDTSFAAVDWDNNTTALERPSKVKYLSDGKILACGTVILVNGVSKPGMVRFNADGTVDSSFTAALTPNAAQPSAVSVYFMHVLSTGKIIVTGAFTGNAKVLNADGTVERELYIGVGDNLNGNISDVYEYPDGRILLFGSDMVFNSVTGLASIRFNSDWTHDATWTGSSRMGIQAQPIRLPTNDGFIVVGKGSGGQQGAVVVDDTGAYVRDYSYVYGTGPYLSAVLAADGSLYMAASPLRKGSYPREQNASSTAQVIHALPAS